MMLNVIKSQLGDMEKELVELRAYKQNQEDKQGKENN